MTEGKFRHLPVVEQSQLIGIVSIGDVVKYRAQQIEFESAALREYIRTAWGASISLQRAAESVNGPPVVTAEAAAATANTGMASTAASAMLTLGPTQETKIRLHIPHAA
jgi:signal-transduction protein with cAMP-binding, CBS, and nucleotidyltransferase domain